MRTRQSIMVGLALLSAAAMAQATRCEGSENDASVPTAAEKTSTHELAPEDQDVHYHALLGASLRNLDGRVRVIAILPKSSAALAGLQVGDEIRTVGGERIRTAHDLNYELGEHAVGEPVKLGILRDEKLRSLTARVGMARPSAARSRANPAETSAAGSDRSAYGSTRRHATGYRGPQGPAGAPTGPNVGADEFGDTYGGEPSQGLDRARREADPDSDLRPRSRSAEREMDRAEREFDRTTNRLIEKAGTPDDLDRPLTREPRGYRVLSPASPPSPQIDNVPRGPEQYYGRPGASYGEHGDYPIPGEKGGISRDRRQVTAPDEYEPDRAGRTSAEDRTTRLKDQYNTHADRRNGRPDSVTGENDSQIRTQRPSTRPVPAGRPWRPDSSGGGSAFPAPASNRGINPPTEGN